MCLMYGMYNGRNTGRPKERRADRHKGVQTDIDSEREVEKNSERQMDA